MNKLLKAASLIEAIAGFSLMILPSYTIRWLFDAEISGISVIITRIAGFALFVFSLTVWTGALTGETHNKTNWQKSIVMLMYNVIITLYLLYIGILGDHVGLLLWPVVSIHAVISALLIRKWMIGK